MTEAFVFTETDKTKSKWVAKVYHDFVEETGRPRTTLRGLFYFALQRKASDYPICGGFVGEIRITRPYHENDGEKLLKWMSKARTLRFIPADAILDGISGENVFLPEARQRTKPIEVWLNRSALNPLLHPVCEKHGAALVSVNGSASNEAIMALYRRCNSPTTVLCLSDLSPVSAFFARDTAAKIVELRPQGCDANIGLKSIGLLPEQIKELKIPVILSSSGTKEEKEEYKRYLKPHDLDPRKMAELDALEVCYPGGMAGFLDDILSGSAISRDIESQS